MADVPVTHDQIIEPNVFGDASESADVLLEKIAKLIFGFKQLATVTGKKVSVTDPKTLDEAEELSRDLKKLIEMYKGVTEAEKLHIKVQVESAKRNAEIRAEIKGQTSAYQQLQNELNKYRQTAKDLLALQAQGVVLNKEQTATLKDATDKTQLLDTKLKQIDATLGQHQRNVGNYNAATKTVTKGLHGLTGVMSTVAHFLGIHTEAFDRLNEVTGHLVKGNKELQHALHLTHLSHSEGTAEVKKATDTMGNLTANLKNNTVATEANTIATKEMNAVGMSATTVWGLVAAGVLGAVAAIIYLTTKTYDAKNAIKELEEGINNVGKDSATKLEEDLRSALVTVDSKMLALKAQLIDANSLLDRKDLSKEDREKIEEDRKKILEQLADFENEKIVKSQEITLKGEEKKTEIIKKGSSQQIKARIEELKQFEELDKKKLDKYDDNFTEEQKNEAEYNNTRLLTRGEYTNILLARKDHFDSQIEDLEEQLTETMKKEEEERVKNTKKSLEEQKKAQEDYLKMLMQIADAQRLIAKNNQEKEDKEKKDAEEKRIKDADDYRAWLKQQAEMHKEAEEFDKKQRMDEEKERQDQLDEDKKALEELNKQRLDMANKYSDAYFDILEKNAQRELDVNEKKMSELDRQAEFQKQLFLSGQINTYNELEKKRVEMLEERDRIEKKAAREKEARDMVDLFLELMKANLKDGGNPNTAAAKSLAQTISIKALTKLFGGNFADGVEDFKGKGGPRDDANIIGFSTGESVVTAKGTSETPGLVTALNKRGKVGAKEWALKHIFPTLPAVSDQRKDVEVAKYMLAGVTREIEKLNRNIEQIPDVTFKETAMGEIMRIRRKMGIIEQTTFKEVKGSYAKK